MLSHHKGQSTNSATKSPDLASKKADQEERNHLSTPPSQQIFFKVLYIILEKCQSFSTTKPLRKACRHLLKFACLENCYIRLSPPLSTEKQQDSVTSPAVLALGKCLQVAGRDPQKLSTFHFDDILDFFFLTGIFLVPSVD